MLPRENIRLLEGPFLKTAAVKLDPATLQTLDSLYAFYHRQWWCHTRMYRLFKVRHALLNGMALLVMAAGMIAGSVLENTIVVTCLAALGTVLKGWNDFKKLSLKVDMCRFAYTTYAKTLTELRNYVRGIPFDENGFLIKMETFDDTITDFAPLVSEDCTPEYHRRFCYVPVEGACFADGCPREPLLNTPHNPLRPPALYIEPQ